VPVIEKKLGRFGVDGGSGVDGIDDFTGRRFRGESILFTVLDEALFSVPNLLLALDAATSFSPGSFFESELFEAPSRTLDMILIPELVVGLSFAVLLVACREASDCKIDSPLIESESSSIWGSFDKLLRMGLFASWLTIASAA
jgi:hypothetical protein